MKKTIIILLLALSAVPSFAQRDVKTLNGKTPAQIIAILGQQPCKNQHPAYWSEYDFPDLAHMEFDNNETVIEVFIDDGDEHVFIDRFSTTTNRYCFLSDYVPGGFKVGDTLQKIQSYDFAKSKYGRNNPKNALHLGQDPKWYIAFQEEGYRLSFRVMDNVVVEIWLRELHLPVPGHQFHHPLHHRRHLRTLHRRGLVAQLPVFGIIFSGTLWEEIQVSR